MNVVALALALASYNAAPNPGRPYVEARYTICDRCDGTERTGCMCASVNAAARDKAAAKRNRKNAARLVQFDQQRAGQLRAGV